jgi:hypothetical protein
MVQFGEGRDLYTGKSDVVRFAVVSTLLTIAVLLALLAASAMGADAASTPPANGNWNIGTGEVVTHTGATFDLRGDLDVRGVLELDNCTLWVWLAPTPRTLVVHPGGQLRLVNSVVASQDDGEGYSINAEEGSVLLLDRAAIFRAGHDLTSDGRQAGVWVATDDATLSGTQFWECLVGLWVSATDVEATDCDLVDCRYGVVVDAGGHLDIARTHIQLCTFGMLSNASVMRVTDSNVTGCDEGILAYGGNLTVTGTDVSNCSIVGVAVYSGEATITGCVIHTADADGIVVQESLGWISSCRFDDLLADIKVVHSEAWLLDNVHRDTYDEAMWMYHSTFHVRRITTQDSYWALRGWKSTGECLDLTAINATYGAHLERCDGVLIDGLVVEQQNRSRRHLARGLYITSGNLTLRNATISGVRTGIDMLSAAADIRWVRIDDCYQDGVMVSLCWYYRMSDVNVTRADDGYWLNLYSGGRLERCVASLCRSTGFNFSAGATTVLVECNSSANPVGVSVQYASPTLLDCEMYMCDGRWHLTNETLGMEFLSGSPRVIGGSLVGGFGGIRTNNTRALIDGVTFSAVERWAILVMESTGDVVTGCNFSNLNTATGVFVWRGTTVIEDCTFYHINYAIEATDNSHVVVEGNSMVNVTWDGIWVFDNSTAEMRGNLIRDVGYFGIHVMLYSSVSCDDDVIMDVGSRGVYVWKASSFTIHGGSIINSSVGVYAFDASNIEVSFTEIRDLNRGIIAYKDRSYNALSASQHLRVEGCYMTNHSAYAIGAFDVNLTVVDCNFLDNIAAIQASNSTVLIEDCTMVGSWLFGVKAEGSTKVTWVVNGRCRVLSSDLLGDISIRVEGGDLMMEDILVEPEATSYLRSTTGSRVAIRGCIWRGDGARVRLVGSDVELTNSTFTAVGPILGGSPGELGVSISGGSVEVTGCIFQRTRTGLSLVDAGAKVTDSQFVECGEAGIYARGSDLELVGTRINRTMVGAAVQLVSSTMEAVLSSITIGTNGVVMVGSEATMTNCSVGGASTHSLSVNASILVLVNTTYQTDRIEVTGGGEVEVWWLVTARVLWPDEEELASTLIWVQDGTDVIVGQGNPDAGGTIRWIPVLSIVHRGDGVSDHGPHLVGADLFGYTVTKQVTLSSSVNVLLDLKDTDPPVFQVLGPLEKELWTMRSVLSVFGTAEDEGAGTKEVRVYTDYNPTSLRSQGDAFSFQVRLADGRHVVELRAVDLAGNEATYSIVVWVETDPLVMSPPEPTDGTLTNQREVTVHGRLSRVEGVTVRVNRALASLDMANRSYSLQVDLVEGENRLSVLVEDVYGHESWWNLTVFADWTPPSLVVTSSRDVNTTDEWVEITGTVDRDARLYIQGSLVLLREGSFSVKYPVYVGESAVTVRAEDEIGNQQELVIYVFRREVSSDPPEADPWEAYIFLVIVPIMMVVVFLVLRRIEVGGEGS